MFAAIPRHQRATRHRRRVEQRLTVYGRAARQLQNPFAKHLGLEENQVRVLTKERRRLVPHQGARLRRRDGDGGAEQLLKRPVKFVADRFKSFSTDIHARDHRVKAKMASSATATSPRRPASDLIRSIRERAASKRTRSSTWSAGRTRARITAPAPASSFRTRTSCANTAPVSATPDRDGGHEVLVELAAARTSAWTRSSSAMLPTTSTRRPAPPDSRGCRITPRSKKFWR